MKNRSTPAILRVSLYVAEDFCIACDRLGITAHAALQRFVVLANIYSYASNNNTSAVSLTGQFILACQRWLSREGKLERNDTIRSDIAVSYMQRMYRLRLSSKPPEEKQLLYLQLVNNWYAALF
jgi:hypothetical protein